MTEERSDEVSVTAIIASYNESVEQINLTLTSCLNQTIPFDRIILVNDGSDSFNASEIIQHELIEILNLPLNQGIAAARNRALTLVDSKFVAILNIEIQLISTWLEQSVDIFNKYTKVGAAYGRLVAANSNLITNWRFQFHEQKYPKHFEYSTFAPGHAVLFHKKVVDEVGRYDEQLKLVHEDADICFRIRSKGYHIVYEPSVCVISMQNDTYESIGKKHVIRITVGRINSISLTSFLLLLSRDHIYRIIRNLYKRRFLFALIDWRISFESLRYFIAICK